MSTEATTPKYQILDDIDVPENVLINWQITVDLLAEIGGIPAALIMRVHAADIEVFVASHTPGNVYLPGEKALLNTGLYCETVMNTQRELVVPNALKDPEWDHNPDISLGMISYCGLPLTWPNGQIFGTICILDVAENSYIRQTHQLLACFRDSIQFNLESIYNAASEHKQAADELQENSEMLSLFLKYSPIYAYIKSVTPTESRVIRASENFKDMVGIPGSQMAGKTMDDLFQPEFAAQITSDDWKVVAGGETIMMDEELNGRHFSTIKFPINIRGRNLLAGYTIDITSRLLEEQERKGLEEQLRQAQKMEAIGTLAGGIAHDFNNILTAIIGFGELVIDDLPAGSVLREQQEQVLKAGQRAKELVKQILTFSRRTEQKHHAVMVHLIAKEALKLLRASIPTSVEIRQDIDPNSGLVLTDPSQIHQVLMNLCTNAYHAMREKGGVLTVNLKARRLEPGDPLLGAELAPGDYVCLEVSDTGSGMTPAIREKIFEPYFTTKGKGDGTGLGLSVVHGIVHDCGGRILVDSTPGRGSTFKVLLPRVEAAVVNNHPAGKEALPGGNERLLVVDDELPIVQMELKILENLGYRVTAMNSSADTLKLFLADPAAFDLLITDMTMPEMTGAELAEQVLAARPAMPIILCTGFSSTLDPQKAGALGIKKYLTKPLSKKDLAKAVRAVLDNIPESIQG